MQHNYRFPVLKVKMITPSGNHTYLKILPQVESKLSDGSKSGKEMTWGIDLDVAEEVVGISTQTIDYVNGVTDPTTFIFQIVDECITKENTDMVYYIFDHNKCCFMEA